MGPLHVIAVPVVLMHACRACLGCASLDVQQVAAVVVVAAGGAAVVVVSGAAVAAGAAGIKETLYT